MMKGSGILAVAAATVSSALVSATNAAPVTIRQGLVDPTYYPAAGGYQGTDDTYIARLWGTSENAAADPDPSRRLLNYGTGTVFITNGKNLGHDANNPLAES